MESEPESAALTRHSTRGQRPECVESESEGTALTRRSTRRQRPGCVESKSESAGETLSTQRNTRQLKQSRKVESVSYHGLEIQQSFRSHLTLVEPTPGMSDASISSSDPEEDGKCDALHCKIGAYKGSIFKWIQCDSCDKYFHEYCVGFKKTPKNDYFCPGCV